MQFRSDIPGRPETQVGRWHAMRNWRRDEREKAGHGGEVVGLGDEEEVDWETIWRRGPRDNAVPPALRRLRCVRLCCSLVPSFPCMTTVLFRRALRGGNQDVNTIITLSNDVP